MSKWVDFSQQKPPEVGDYWYRSHPDDKPRIHKWCGGKQGFRGPDRDQYGPYSYRDPTHWAVIDYPEESSCG